MKKEEKRVSLVDSYLTHHVKTEEERQEILEEIRRNTNQLQNLTKRPSFPAARTSPIPPL